MNDHAIIVGINRYPELGDLQGPVHDARRFHEWATNDGGVDPKNAKLIVTEEGAALGDPLTAEPTTSVVDHAFEKLAIAASDAGAPLGRRLYLYFAGHGFSPNIDDAALLMANAGRRRSGHHIPGRYYANTFRAAAAFEEVVLFMDCCREIVLRARMHFPPWDDGANAAGAATRHFYGFATEWSRAAREKAIDGHVQGLFTTALLRGLRHARDEDGRVTSSSLERFVMNMLPSMLDDKEQQEPKFEYDHQHELVFSDAESSDVPLRIKAPAGSGPPSVVDGLLRPVGVTAAGPSEWIAMAKTIGVYRVTLGKAEEYRTVLGLDGEVIDVAF